jgi:tetratricopeptide (TPR) repeat protein
MKKLFLTVFLTGFLAGFFFAQDNTGSDIRLAYEYYRTKDYDKAEILFQKIYLSTGAKIYFTYYANCLMEQGKFEQAEKEIKKQLKKNKDDAAYLVDLGYLYKKQSDLEKAGIQFNEALQNIGNNSAAIRSLASAFMQREEFEYAEKVYLKGRRIVQDNFRADLANLYAIQRKFDKMINEYLDFLEESSTNQTSVQDRMQLFINNDVNNEFSEILKKELIKRIQKPDASIAFNKMLIWYYLQRKEFEKALYQEIAVDKRLNTSGKDVLELAETAKANMDFKSALDAYNYVIDKGKSKPYYIPAQTGKLNVYYLQVINGFIQTEDEIKQLEEQYLSTLNSTGIGQNTVQIVIDLAHLQAFYLNKPAEAEQLLDQAIQLQGLDPRLAALCKIELGDVLIFNNDLDYAALIYGQVEKDNKDNQTGDNAKLRKAKLAYFANNFQWAKAQFDALKESTSKQVANDALYYSILIEENSEGDSLQLAVKAYADAELDLFRNRFENAVVTLDSLILNTPGHQIIDDAYMLKALICERKKDYSCAEEIYKKVFTDFAYDITADLAMFNLGKMYEEKMNMRDEAAEQYKKLMIQYPESIYVEEARKRYRAIRENVI